eukprot:SAG11_NODE_4767_length_1775_cov_2.899165_3_plen_57_part_01
MFVVVVPSVDTRSWISTVPVQNPKERTNVTFPKSRDNGPRRWTSPSGRVRGESYDGG